MTSADPVRAADYRGRTVLVAGARTAGAAAARALVRAGADVCVTDRGVPEQSRDLPALGVRLVGDVPADPGELLVGVDQVVTSPGFPPEHPLFVTAAALGIEVIGDVELAWRLRCSDVPWLGVTGTNGKTTTVRMLTAILRAAGIDAVAAGNVGTPLVEVVRGAEVPDRDGPDVPDRDGPDVPDRDGPDVPDRDGPDVIVAELSSFQLHWTSTVRCAVATVLNLAEDHLDWHGSMQAYADDKGRIVAADTVAVVNADDPWSQRLARPAARIIRFAPGTPGAPGGGDIGVIGDAIVEGAGDAEPLRLAVRSDIGAPGPHNLANALAAVAMARAFAAISGRELTPAQIGAGLRAFVPDPHRNAAVGTAAGVSYVDDSKATNPHAAAASLAAYPRVVWIAGGLLKGADTDDLVAGAAGRLAGAVLIGRDRAVIAASIARHAPQIPVVEVLSTDDGAMAEAVQVAAAMAGPGDTVLLAPAAASLDMFTDYHARGEAFAAAARERGAV